MVDHLANAIEEHWKENPDVSFDEALNTEFKKFGIFGFTGLVEQKQNELHKHYNKMLWNEVLRFISIPKVVITVVLYVLIFFFLKYSQQFGEIVILSLLLLSFVYYFFDSIWFVRKIKKQQKAQNRSWLMQSVAHQVMTLPFIYMTGFGYSMISNFFREGNNALSVLGLNVFTVFILIHILTFYVFSAIIKPRLLQSIKETEGKFQFV